jgi:hypothetical protein
MRVDGPNSPSMSLYQKVNPAYQVAKALREVSANPEVGNRLTADTHTKIAQYSSNAESTLPVQRGLVVDIKW